MTPTSLFIVPPCLQLRGARVLSDSCSSRSESESVPIPQTVLPMAWCKAYYCERGRTMGLWSYTHWPLVPYTTAGPSVRADGRVRGGGRRVPRIRSMYKTGGVAFF